MYLLAEERCTLETGLVSVMVEGTSRARRAVKGSPRWLELPAGCLRLDLLCRRRQPAWKVQSRPRIACEKGFIKTRAATESSDMPSTGRSTQTGSDAGS